MLIPDIVQQYAKFCRTVPTVFSLTKESFRHSYLVKLMFLQFQTYLVKLISLRHSIIQLHTTASLIIWAYLSQVQKQLKFQLTWKPRRSLRSNITERLQGYSKMHGRVFVLSSYILIGRFFSRRHRLVDNEHFDRNKGGKRKKNGTTKFGPWP